MTGETLKVFLVLLTGKCGDRVVGACSSRKAAEDMMLAHGAKCSGANSWDMNILETTVNSPFKNHACELCQKKAKK